MSYRQSPHFLEAQRRANLMRRARTPLGHYWQQKQLVAELKAMIEETRDRLPQGDTGLSPITVVTTFTSSRPS